MKPSGLRSRSSQGELHEHLEKAMKKQKEAEKLKTYEETCAADPKYREPQIKFKIWIPGFPNVCFCPMSECRSTHIHCAAFLDNIFVYLKADVVVIT